MYSRSGGKKRADKIKEENKGFVFLYYFYADCNVPDRLRQKKHLAGWDRHGEKLSWTYDIMGVRYMLYENGYAAIDTILNPYCQLTDTVTYEGEDYAIVQIVNHTDGMVF